MKIAIFVPTLSGGGAEKMMVKLANYFCDEGYIVDLVICNRSGDYFGLLSSKVGVVCLGVERIRSAIFKLSNYLQCERPEVLLSAMNYVNTVASLSVKLSGVKVRHVMSERSQLSSRFSNLGVIRRRLLFYVMGFFYKRSYNVVAISNGVAVDLCECLNLPTYKVEVVYNPACPEDHELSEVSISPDEMEGAPDIQYVVSIGRLVDQKDYFSLISAAEILKDIDDIKFLILGKGVLERELRKYAKDLGVAEKIVFAGFKNMPYPYLKKASLFVLSSKFEGFGNVIVEALACGTKVVSTDCPSGPAEILGDGRWGRLVPVGDPQALADAIVSELSSNPRSDLAMRAKDFSVDSIGKAYLRAMGF